MHLGTKSRDEKNAEKIAKMRGEKMNHADMRAAMKSGEDEEFDTAIGPVNARKSWPKVASKMKARRERKGSDGQPAPIDHLPMLLNDIIPGLTPLLESEPAGWGASECERAQKVIVIILRAEPTFLEDEEDEEATEDEPSEDVTVEAVHAACEKAEVDCESKAFRDACEEAVGEAHLDKMTPEQLAQVKAGVEKGDYDA